VSDPKYLRSDLGSLLGHFIEECGESLAAAGKTLRRGLDSSNPELPPGWSGRVWLLRELDDLELAITRLRPSLKHKEGSGG
jgi:hypothetical protein